MRGSSTPRYRIGLEASPARVKHSIATTAAEATAIQMLTILCIIFWRTSKVMAILLAGANVERGVEVVVTGNHR